ncbi:glycosyltransferase [Ruicaihuangia caeni]|uniref:Glycosyltransferase n=1 Tax=Ruicaihuangia caeni TaxID=3042517 RepID=A0AAW6T8X7_9MICO|nr:glycosyltransferase [Klugiella sp. YN-L-19]MDI2098794.1 glycosyltransferase [Klugiella sp. YN-L-19]
MSPRRVLMISADAGGNVPPALAIANELAGRGHEVTLAGVRPRDSGALEMSVERVPLAALAHDDLTDPGGSIGQLAALRHLTIGPHVAEDVRSLLDSRRPDAVVVDCAMLSSLREALGSGVPTAALFHSFGAFWQRWFMRGPIDLASRLLRLRAVSLWARADVRLLATDPELDPASRRDFSRDLKGIRFEWTGTTEIGVPPAPREAGAMPLVLVSLSSAWIRGQADAYRRIIAALADSPVRAIVTTGGAEIESELRGGSSVQVLGRAPHAELLPEVDLVIGHGGHSTTLKALAHGIPVLVLPMNLISDQRMVGRIVQAAGVGRMLPRSAALELIRATVLHMLGDTSLVQSAALTGERLRRQRGASVAADRIEDLWSLR